MKFTKEDIELIEKFIEIKNKGYTFKTVLDL